MTMIGLIILLVVGTIAVVGYGIAVIIAARKYGGLFLPGLAALYWLGLAGFVLLVVGRLTS